MPASRSATSSKTRGRKIQTVRWDHGNGLMGVGDVRNSAYTIRKERENMQTRRIESFINHASRTEIEILQDAGYNVPIGGEDHSMLGGGFEGAQGWEDEDDEGASESDEEKTAMAAKEGRDGIERVISFIHSPPPLSKGAKKKDERDRRDRVKRETEAWEAKRSALADALMLWEANGVDSTEEGNAGHHDEIQVYSIDGINSITLPIKENEAFVVTLVRHGAMGTSPIHPEVAVSIRLLEFVRLLTARCPQLSIQVIAKTLCSLGKITYRQHLRKQFLSAFSIYLELRREIDTRLRSAMKRSAPDYQLKNTCPACSYSLEGESTKYGMIVAMDGNNSLKRVARKKYDLDENGKKKALEIIERDKGKIFEDGMYLTEKYVDEFQYEVKSRRAEKSTEAASAAEPGDTDMMAETVPCVDTWKNLAAESRKKMGSYYRETGVFITACRHGSCLLVCDMIESGELAKYPLAMIDKLLNVFETSLLIGYDIGCGFTATTRSSEKIAQKFKDSGSQLRVGSFHGHAHARVCQVVFHPLYTEGAGLEDLETCERIFSCSNMLARCTRQSSIFYRKEMIVRFFKVMNLDKYAELSRFLYNNYLQAVKLLKKLPKELDILMEKLELSSKEIFASWLNEETIYLNTVQVESVEDILKMDYVETLIKLEETERAFLVASKDFIDVNAIDLSETRSYQKLASQTLQRETARMKSLNTLIALQKAVEDMETKLEIDQRWCPRDDQWKEVAQRLELREFQTACDKLEGLVVARCLEYTKMNQSQLGVKLRKQISDGMRSRSTAIRNALTVYNQKAVTVQPPRPVLEIDELLEFTELRQFDFLRNSRYDIQNQPWARPAGRQAMDIWFKIQRAQEECERVKLETRRLMTYIADEEYELSASILQLKEGDPLLAYQLTQQLKLFMDINTVHILRLKKLSRTSGYSFDISPGTRKGSMDINASFDVSNRIVYDRTDQLINDLEDLRIDSEDDNIINDYNDSCDLLDTELATCHPSFMPNVDSPRKTTITRPHNVVPPRVTRSPVLPNWNRNSFEDLENALTESHSNHHCLDGVPTDLVKLLNLLATSSGLRETTDNPTPVADHTDLVKVHHTFNEQHTRRTAVNRLARNAMFDLCTRLEREFDAVCFIVVGNSVVNPNHRIDAKYLNDEILFWRSPRQLTLSIQAPDIIERFKAEFAELCVRDYATLSLRAGWGSPRFLRYTVGTLSTNIRDEGEAFYEEPAVEAEEDDGHDDVEPCPTTIEVFQSTIDRLTEENIAIRSHNAELEVRLAGKDQQIALLNGRLARLSIPLDRSFSSMRM